MRPSSIPNRPAFARHPGGLRALNLTIMTCLATVMPGGSLRAQVAKFNQIDITIQTGGDDLRKSSSATATLESPKGVQLQVITLKGHNQGSFDNNSMHKIHADLKHPMTRAEIGHIVIALPGAQGDVPG